MPTTTTVFRWLDRAMRIRGIRRRTWSDGSYSMSYLDHGHTSKPTLVLVHGLGTSGLSWIKVVARLARTHRVLAPDLPGWGWSPPPPGKDHATIEDLRDALVAFLEGVVKSPVVLVGQSMGGWAAAKIAASRPDLVSRLVLVNSAGVLYPEVDELRRKLDVRTREDVHRFWTELYHRVPWFYKLFSDDYVAKMHEPRVLNFFESVRDESAFVNADLGNITMPTTIVWGLSDRFIPRTTVDVLIAGLRDVDVFWIPRCGHVPALERPGEFVRVLRSVLGRPVTNAVSR